MWTRLLPNGSCYSQNLQEKGRKGYLGKHPGYETLSSTSHYGFVREYLFPAHLVAMDVLKISRPEDPGYGLLRTYIQIRPSRLPLPCLIAK
jgi:hypothetical protein